MKIWGQVLAVVLTIALGFCPGSGAGISPPPERGVSRCLAVGYDDFVTMADTAPCSANNAGIMSALFRDFVPEAETVVRRVNEPATAAGLETLIRETFGAAKSGDTSYMYLSTHGVVWEENGETRMALMLSDGVTEEALTPGRLRAMLDGIPGEKVLILDACHSGAVTEAFAAPEYMVLASCAAEEDSFFWLADDAEEVGTGYFTTALEEALRASYPEQIDTDGNGEITQGETLDRIAGLYGASRVQGSPGSRDRTLFFLPEKQQVREGIMGLRFDEMERNGDTLVLPFHFDVTEETRLEYRVIPKKDGCWDFDHFATMPDRERTGTVRGLLSPGTKDRKIRLSAENLGAEGEALLQIISLRGIYGQTPVLEGTRVITGGDE